MAWPTLTRRPISEIKTPRENVVKHGTESIHVVRRPRATRTVNDYKLTFDLIESTEALELISHWQLVGLSTSFPWDNTAGETKQVVFDVPLEWTQPIPAWYRFETITLLEV
jgi:hypothetical protein